MGWRDDDRPGVVAEEFCPRLPAVGGASHAADRWGIGGYLDRFEGGPAERGVERVRIGWMAGNVVDVGVTEDRITGPGGAAIRAVEQAADFHGGEQAVRARR